MKIKKKFGDTIIVEWYDAYSDDGWLSFEEASKVDLKVSYTKTNAFFISQDDLFLIVAHTIGKDKTQSINGKFVIPKAWIKGKVE